MKIFFHANDQKTEMIATILIPQLQARFPGRGLRVSGDTPPIATFPAIDSEVGDIEIHDDGDEATLHFGDIAHRHIGNFEFDLPLVVREQKIVDVVVETLELLFAEKIEFYRTRWGGGWGPRGTGEGEIFIWSGRISTKPE